MIVWLYICVLIQVSKRSSARRCYHSVAVHQFRASVADDKTFLDQLRV